MVAEGFLEPDFKKVCSQIEMNGIPNREEGRNQYMENRELRSHGIILE